MFKMRRKPERLRPRTQGHPKSAGRNIRAACRQDSSAAPTALPGLPTGNSINTLYRGREGPYFPEFVFSISSMKEVRYRRVGDPPGAVRERLLSADSSHSRDRRRTDGGSTAPVAPFPANALRGTNAPCLAPANRRRRG